MVVHFYCMVSVYASTIIKGAVVLIDKRRVSALSMHCGIRSYGKLLSLISHAIVHSLYFKKRRDAWLGALSPFCCHMNL